MAFFYFGKWKYELLEVSLLDSVVLLETLKGLGDLNFCENK